MKRILLACTLFAAACGGGAAPAPGPTEPATAEPTHEEEHHGDLPDAVHSFHEALRPLWHSEAGPERTDKVCAAVPDLQAEAGPMSDGSPVPEDKLADYSSKVGALKTALVELDQAWLKDANRKFPVTVDPSVIERNRTPSMYVQRTGNSSFTKSDGLELKVGHASGGINANTYLKFPGIENDLRNHRIFGAQLFLLNYYSWSCRPFPMQVHAVTQDWNEKGSYNYPGPSVDNNALTSSSFAQGYIPRGAMLGSTREVGIVLVQEGQGDGQREYVGEPTGGSANSANVAEVEREALPKLDELVVDGPGAGLASAELQGSGSVDAAGESTGAGTGPGVGAGRPVRARRHRAPDLHPLGAAPRDRRRG